MVDSGILFFFFQAEDGIRDVAVTGVQTCALPICRVSVLRRRFALNDDRGPAPAMGRSEEHTSELQSRLHLVCRLLLEKKKKKLIAKLRRFFVAPNFTTRTRHPPL